MWKKQILSFLALLFCFSEVFASSRDTISVESLQGLQYPKDSSISAEQWMVLKQATINLLKKTIDLKQNSMPARNSLDNSDRSSTNLDALLSQGSSLFDLLDNQLLRLQQQLSSSETTITALQHSLLKANEIIVDLKNSLTNATVWANQMGERLQENNEDLARAYSELDAADVYAIKLQNKANRSGTISLSFGLVGGASLAWGVTDAIYSHDPMKAVYGVGGGLVSFGLWAIGHWAFDWW